MAMASTPAVGPNPTTRTNTSAQTSSGTERSTTVHPRTACLSHAGPRAMRPPTALTDSRSVIASASGSAIRPASAMPAVAIATVRQVSRASNARNSASWRSGTNCARKRPVTRRLRASNSVHGWNSASTSSGHSTTTAASTPNMRRDSAGSRPAPAFTGTSPAAAAQ